MLKNDQNILRGLSGSSCFLSKNIEKFNQTGNLDLKLVGIAGGILPNENESKLGDDDRIKIKNSGGIIFKNKFIEKILKNKFT
jgi:hypothetical protein